MFVEHILLQEIAAVFSTTRIDEMKTEFNHFLNNLETVIGVYKDLAEKVNTDLITAYVDMMEFVFRVGKFYGPQKFLDKARALTIWKSPVSTLEDPTNPSESESLRINDLEEFLRSQAQKAIMDIVNGFSGTLIQGLSDLKDNLRASSTKLLTNVDSAKTHYSTLLAQTLVDHQFVT